MDAGKNRDAWGLNILGQVLMGGLFFLSGNLIEIQQGLRGCRSQEEIERVRGCYGDLSESAAGAG